MARSITAGMDRASRHLDGRFAGRAGRNADGRPYRHDAKLYTGEPSSYPEHFQDASNQLTDKWHKRFTHDPTTGALVENGPAHMKARRADRQRAAYGGPYPRSTGGNT